MKRVFTAMTAVWACGAFAEPIIDDSEVTLSQDVHSRLVTISYTLKGEPGIVTADIQTNYVEEGETKWASIGAEHFANMLGAVNRVVTNLNETQTIQWLPERFWPDHLFTEGNVRAVLTAWATNAPPDYMVVDLGQKKHVRFYTSSNAVPHGICDRRYKTSLLLMRKIHAAGVTFRMGATEEDIAALAVGSRAGHRRDEPLHQVSFSDDFYIGVYEVTQGQWLELSYATGLTTFNATYKSYSDSALRPMEYVSYSQLRGLAANGYDWPIDGHDVDPGLWIGKLRTLSGGIMFDLPTESQWEYACRAGTKTPFNNGKSTHGDVAWSGDNSATENPPDSASVGQQTHAVGLKKPNAWGLYDMHGNVNEWCLDWLYNDSDYGEGVFEGTDPAGPATSLQTQRTYRGAGYNWSGTTFMNLGRSASRYRVQISRTDVGKGSFPGIGFRLWCPARVCE
ncbi:MAG: formylglycine-generating enzyme family protein [Kiritimatiellae bacterium]|nr:formylglycine-generating enzyme family protein [Kiritimatiellia bacterium]